MCVCVRERERERERELKPLTSNFRVIMVTADGSRFDDTRTSFSWASCVQWQKEGRCSMLAVTRWYTNRMVKMMVMVTSCLQ